MPKVGDKEFPYTPEGMAAAKAESQNMGIPVNDGANRSVTEYAGGGKTGYSAIGMQKPMMYEEGGKTNPLDQDGDGKISLHEKNIKVNIEKNECFIRLFICIVFLF